MDPAEPLRSNLAISLLSLTPRVQHTYRPCPAGFQERQPGRKSAARAPRGRALDLREQRK